MSVRLCSVWRPAACAVLLALAGVLAAGAELAAAQSPLAPSLSVDTAFAPSSGIARDNSPNTTTDVPGGVAVDGDRIYTVGESGGDAAIVARKVNGVLDSGFSGDGRLNLALGNGRDVGLAIVVLPDHRLRVLAASDVDPSGVVNFDVALVGLLPDGADDPAFGEGDGRLTFPIGTGTTEDSPSRMLADAAGRLAIVGTTRTAGKDDTFVSLREADGDPITAFDTDGVRVLDRGGASLGDRGLDIAFRPGGGLVALLSVATSSDASVNDWVPVLHAFDESGADDNRFSDDGDLVLAVGDPVTGTAPPGGLIAFGGRLWVTGSTKAAADTDAFLARVEADGTGLQFRRFDMRGGRIAPDQAIVSRGVDLDVLPGTPNTLVVVGSIDFQTSTFWSAAAFNKIEGPLAAAGYGDLLLPTDEDRSSMVGVAAGKGWLAAAGSLRTSTGVIDSAFGTIRLFVDAEKRCDLAIDVLNPPEIDFDGSGRPQTITVQVTNAGTKACAGSVSARAPYQLRLGALAGAIGTGVLYPGASYTTSGALLTYGGPRRPDDVLQVSVTAPGDANPENNISLLGVTFSYCDVQLRPSGSFALAPTEGSRRFELSLRNAGTVPCRRVRVATGAGARMTEPTDFFSLEPGRSASEEVAAAVAGPRRVGRRARIVFRARADADVEPRNDIVAVSPMLVGVGDTNARKPGPRARAFVGRAVGGRGPVRRRRLRVTKVDVAVRRLGRSCRWLSSKRPGFRRGRGRRCDRPVWLRASGTRRWRYVLSRRLPRGRYVLLSRATIAAGFAEASFSTHDRNRVVFRVR